MKLRKAGLWVIPSYLKNYLQNYLHNIRRNRRRWDVHLCTCLAAIGSIWPAIRLTRGPGHRGKHAKKLL